ncbi:MAG: glycosyltransferase family 1 protein [Spirochaetia bacterium]
MVYPEKITNIGFVSTRLKGTDGVSLETAKWVEVFEDLGYTCYFFAGLSDWEKEKTMVVPEAYFNNPQIRALQERCFGMTTRTSEITGEIHHYRMVLKNKLYEFQDKFNIDCIIPENALTIPMNIPLGLAITEFIAETGIPTIAHHHDFYWERQRFIVNCVPDFLTMSFPPVLPSIQHVVINTQADSLLSYRTGISAHVIPNILDFNTEPPGKDEYNRDVRRDLGLEEDDIFILQPTRIVARKGIEHSIELVSRLNNGKAKLVISHSAGDEGFEYEKRVRGFADLMGVELVIRPDIIGEERGTTEDGRKIYNLWDIYPYADFVTYPSIYEGFGNAFLEAIYFRKPIMVNRYSIYETDIEPRGFNVISMNGYVTDEVVGQVEDLLANPGEIEEMVEKNFAIAKKFFSFESLINKLKNILLFFEGVSS